jgi:hypothetical protein
MATTYTGTKAQTGAGTELAIGATPGVIIGELADFPLSRPKWETADVTNFQSGKDAEYITTIRKASTLTLKGNRVGDDAGQVAVETAYQSGEPVPFLATLPKSDAQTTAGDTFTFNALVLGFDFSITPTKQIDFSVDLQLTGNCAFAPGS